MQLLCSIDAHIELGAFASIIKQPINWCPPQFTNGQTQSILDMAKKSENKQILHIPSFDSCRKRQ